MRNIALRLAYDGTDFSGSQWQPNGRSVQDELERAWVQLTQDPRRITFAGRTDAGVHADAQMVSVLSETNRDLGTIQRGLNALLPEDIAVIGVWEVPLDFHARFSAVRRAYRYLIDPAPFASPLLRRQAFHVARPLAMREMNAALAYLLGTHDFAAFAASTQEGPTVRTIERAQIQPLEVLGVRLLALDIAANGFLRHMVRTVVGTVLLVGIGKIDVAGFATILQDGDRRKAGETAPAHGLSLTSVEYPPGLIPDR